MKNEEAIRKIIDYLFKVLERSRCFPVIPKKNQITWVSPNLPYEELQDTLILMGETEYLPVDFDFKVQAMRGDSISYKLTLTIKEVEPKP